MTFQQALLFGYVLLCHLATPALADTPAPAASAAPAPVIQLLPPQPTASADVLSQKDFAKGQGKQPVTAGSRCGEVGAMQYMLMSTRQMAYLATAIDTAQIVHIYMRNNRTENWVELEVGNDLNACIVREGTDFHFLVHN